MKKIYFVRHGETEANVNNIIAGGEYESPLTKNGKSQARKAGQKLKLKNIDSIVCSPMERTIDTATIIAKEIGISLKDIIIDEAFVEVYNAYYSGKSYETLRRHIEEGRLVDDIEKPDSVKARVQEGMNRIKKLPGQNIVLVSHGATGRMVRAVINNIPHHDFMDHEKFENAEIYEFELD
ncbi:MAG TPA: histidine phosphatase family protein [Candidatus Saccharibacteria bacterium]|nr:histidine phosphatase family protein [Candidatus Saccharibacteria bacterium]